MKYNLNSIVKKFFLTTSLFLLNLTAANAETFKNPILPPSDAWQAPLTNCVLTAFKSASGLTFRSTFIANGPTFAHDAAGADIKNKAEFLIAGELTSGERHGFKTHFNSLDGQNWSLYQDSQHGIGMTSGTMDSNVNVYNYKTNDLAFIMDLAPCRTYIEH
ncbi:MAG: hypothetical protein NT027_08285 [Proteobacteria bacterium]|nr:hypothetical protein [Pseudomonadota bacterium]